jgi:hypothetical protein
MLILYVALLASAGAAAATPHDRLACEKLDNVEICAIFKSDQLERTRNAVYEERKAQERTRSVRAALADDTLRTANDHYKAAILLMHSNDRADLVSSHVVAMSGLRSFPADERMSLVAALSLDRYLISLGQPQVFSTQFGGDASKLEPILPSDCSTLSSSTRRRFVANYPETCEKRK